MWGHVHARYEDSRQHGVQCANEAEFQGYYVITAADPEVLSGRLAQLPRAVVNAPRMQRALRILASIQSGDFVGFFRELKQAREREGPHPDPAPNLYLTSQPHPICPDLLHFPRPRLLPSSRRTTSPPA